MTTSKYPIVLNIPHASAATPLSLLDQFCIDEKNIWKEILHLTDWYSDELFNIPNTKAVVTPVSRLVIDTERYSNDLEEPMSHHGMGCIYQKGVFGTNIRGELTEEQKNSLLETFYYPHHQKLEESIQECLDEFNCCFIVDCHTFPEVPFDYESNKYRIRPDICIGTHSHNTPPKLVSQLKQYFTSEKLEVAVNFPYEGCIVPEKFIGNPRVIAIMIEVNRKLYIDDISNNNFLADRQKPTKTDNFDLINCILSRAITEAAEAFANSSLLSCRLRIRENKNGISSKKPMTNVVATKLSELGWNVLLASLEGSDSKKYQETINVSDYGDEYNFFSDIVSICKNADLESIDVINSDNTILRITKDTLVIRPYTAIINKESIVQKPGCTFTPQSELMSENTKYYYLSSQYHSKHFTYMRLRLNKTLVSYDLLMLANDMPERSSIPAWIGAIAPLANGNKLIWPPNSDVEKNVGYILYDSYHKENNVD